MRNRLRFVSFSLLVLILFSGLTKKPAKTEKFVAPPPGSEAAADAALGTLPTKGETEAEKKVQEIAAEDEAHQALEEAERRRREEEQKRLHESITGYDIAERQIQES
ncbi:MAG: hypothetical protein HY584_05715 [Candidatus Omnitrophica bacterium]|nr:hypothetical protein [Candidatus Omnitrophota bacterium]